MKVKEIMNKVVSSVRPEDNAEKSLALLFKMQISGLPVIDGEGKLVGMFTEKDVLRYALPSYLDQVGKFVYEESPKATKIKFMDLRKMEVAQLMRREVVTTEEDAALCEVARIMLTEKARRMPVLNKLNKVVGIIARNDVLKALAKEAELSL